MNCKDSSNYQSKIYMINLQEYNEEGSSLIQKINELQGSIQDKILKIL
ncbi:hypothetical protein [Leptospira kirschneri]|nr:hypothetical protein [Leptospira kirschneri]